MEILQGTPYPLGVSVNKNSINFSVTVEKDYDCILLLYQKDASKPTYRIPMPKEEGIGAIRFVAVKGIRAREYFYTYFINGKEVLDPYVQEVVGKRKFGDPIVDTARLYYQGVHIDHPSEEEEKKTNPTLRGRVFSAPYDWEGDKPLKIPHADVISYALHVRGFTRHSSSKVRCKGTFAGVVEKLPYLTDLGINQIICMPVYEFDELLDARTKKVNFWGYGPGFYFAPKATYAGTKGPVRELKDMVKACHKAGIEVVLDFPFANGVLPQTALACLRYYMLEFHIDGFLLNPYHIPFDTFAKDPLLQGTKMMVKDDTWQNQMRAFLKSDEGKVEEAITNLAFANVDETRFHYITSQTGFTLKDLVSYDGKHNEANGEQNADGPLYNYSWNCGAEGPSRKKEIIALRKQQMRNAFFLLLTAQGMPCLLAGDEFENTQKGNNNAYCQDNEVGWLDWNLLKRNAEMHRFVRSFIALRKSNALLHQSQPLKGIDYTSCGFPDVSFHGEEAWQSPIGIASRQLGMLLYQESQVPKAKDIGATFVAMNMHWMNHKFALPTLPKKMKYYLVADTKGGVYEKPILLKSQKELHLEQRSIAVLVGK